MVWFGVALAHKTRMMIVYSRPLIEMDAVVDSCLNKVSHLYLC